jgi:hypothetical protein
MRANSPFIILLTYYIICGYPFNCAENEPLAPEEKTIPIETTFKAGPEEGAILPHNSAVTFSWDGTIQPGEITSFSYSFEEIIDDTTLLKIAGDSALIRSYCKSNLTTGNFRFSVRAHAEHGDSLYTDDTPAVRHFSVIADTLAPIITILAGPKDGSFTTPGANLFFEWTASDPSPGGEIVSYSFVLADAVTEESDLNWSLPRLETRQTAYYMLSEGIYHFWLKATDISGLSTVTFRLFTVKPADILFAIDRGLTTDDIDFWHQHVLKDFAYEDFYLSSDPGEFFTKIDPAVYSTIVWAGNDQTSILPGSEFANVNTIGSLAERLNGYLDNGGHLWISGNDILYDLGGNAWPPMVYGDTSFVRSVLHIQNSAEADSNFLGGLSTGVGDYNDLFTNGDAIFRWCDRVDPVLGEAETILKFVSSDMAYSGQSVAIRYPAGLDNPGETKIVFCGFFITDLSDPTKPVTLRPTDIYQFATIVFNAFGENED